jgi:aspartyl aminopeptidase
LGGARREFVNGARLDNLASCFAATEALLDHCAATTREAEGAAAGEVAEPALAWDCDVSVVALFDHEEVGSGSAAGAGSPVMRDAVERITHALLSLPNANAARAAARSTRGDADGPTPPNGRAAAVSVAASDSEAFLAALERSMVLSVDMAHAVRQPTRGRPFGIER